MENTSKVDLDSTLICTLFDYKYLPAGMAMIESVLGASSGKFHFLVLALDVETFNFIDSLNRTDITQLSLSEFMDDSLEQLLCERSWREFCWTLPAYMLENALNSNLGFNFVAYVDSDCFFFSDFKKLMMELDSSESVLIHPHRFPESKKHMEFESGIFNVGVILGRMNDDFLKVAMKWKEDVTVECTLDPSSGKCGDQTYLNDWPDLFPFVKIARNHGIGAGPWNISSSEYSKRGNRVCVDGEELVFFHFSRFKPIFISNSLSLCAAALGYLVPSIVKKGVYKPYLRIYSKAYKKVLKFSRTRMTQYQDSGVIISALRQNQLVFCSNLRLSLLGRRIK